VSSAAEWPGATPDRADKLRGMPSRADRDVMRARLYARLRELRSDLQTAIDHGDTAEAEAAEKLIEKIEEFLERFDDPREME
jgi:signal transduction protein with GAF and PtsI domain